MNKSTIISLIAVFAFISASLYESHWQNQQIKSIQAKSDSIALAHSVQIQILKNAVDSANARTVELALCVSYLDSVNVAKSAKSDRAERRGRFVGGILKTIFPRL